MYKNILIPVELETEDNANIDAAFAAARDLAEPDAEITVLHVMEALPAYAILKVPGDLLAITQKRLSGALKETAKGLPGAKAVLISGHIGRSILDYAEKKSVDCIIVGAHRPNLQDFLLGSVASSVVQNAKCAVLVVR